MSRIVFVPGAEAMADELNALSDQTVSMWDSAGQRDQLWPAPFDGALSWLADVGTLEQYRDGDVTGAWWPLLTLGADGALTVPDHLNEQDSNSRYLRKLTASWPPPGDGPGSPGGFTSEVTSTGASYQLKQWRADEYSIGGEICMAVGGGANRLVLTPGDQRDNGADLGDMSFQVDGSNSVLNDVQAFVWTMKLGTIDPAYYMYLIPDPSGPSRAKLYVLGDISADNLPSNLMARLAAVEQRLGIEPEPEVRAEPVVAPPDPDLMPEADG